MALGALVVVVAAAGFAWKSSHKPPPVADISPPPAEARSLTSAGKVQADLPSVPGPPAASQPPPVEPETDLVEAVTPPQPGQQPREVVADVATAAAPAAPAQVAAPVVSAQASAEPGKPEGKDGAAVDPPSQPVAAQATAPAPAKPVAKDSGSGAQARLMPFNPYAQFLALQIQLKLAKKQIDWTTLLKKHQRGPFKAEDVKDAHEVLPMLTGIRIADGFVAVMAKDTGYLQEIAEEVEQLAIAQNIDRKMIRGADGIRKAVNRKDWPGIITELGFLQAEIMEQYNGGDGKPLGPETDRAIIAVMAAFLQACTYAADIVATNNPPDLSNYLRIGRYLQQLVDRQDRLPESMRANERVRKCIKGLEQVKDILDIGINDSILPEKIQRLQEIADETLTAISAK